MNGEMKILNYVEDKGKNKDGRLKVGVENFPIDNLEEFLIWAGNEFIKQGGLYAVDLCTMNGDGIYRVYKNKNIGEWLI